MGTLFILIGYGLLIALGIVIALVVILHLDNVLSNPPTKTVIKYVERDNKN